MTSGRLARLSSLFTVFNKFNKRLVYSHISGKKNDNFFIFGDTRKKDLLKNHNSNFIK